MTASRDLLDVLEEIGRERRSGVLSIRDGVPVATLWFSAGRLVRLRRFPATDTLGALLVRAGVLQTADLHGPIGETLEQLVGRVGQRRGVLHLLVRADDAIADEIHEGALAMLARGRGVVSFRADAERIPPRGKVDDDVLTLPSGIDLDEVLMAARARAIRFPLEGGFDALQARAPAVIAVDDDPAFLGTLAAAFGRAHVTSTILSSAAQVLAKLPSLGPEDVLLVDLCMPRASGRGFLGGLEILRAAAQAGLADRVFVCFDAPHLDAEREVARLGGGGVLRRPQADDPVALSAFLRPVLARVAVNFDDGGAAFDLVGALKDELADLDWRVPAQPDSAVVDDGDQLGTLKALLGELNTPTFDEEIPLLVLRFAAAFFARGALFRIDEAHEEFVGLGGFGIGGEGPGRLVKSIRIPLNAPCVLADALVARAGARSRWSTRAADEFLSEQLGARSGDDLFVAPLFSPRGAVTVLVADNAGLNRPFPKLALVEIFLQQAGAALERAALARTIEELRSQPPRPSPGPRRAPPADR
ncbi:MAG: response regulator [Deltaproteobacteria bacterium]|nr:response regulator [Deltaproteobacteria bacterium]